MDINQIAGTIFLVSLAVFIGFLVFLMSLSRKKKQQSWIGEVIKIRRLHTDGEGDDDDVDGLMPHWASAMQVELEYKTEDGRKGRVSMSVAEAKERIPNLKKGDRIVKEAGEDLPRKA